MISTQQHGSTTLLRLEHGKANALDLEFLAEIYEQLSSFEEGDQRALVLTGRGSIFGAGVDLLRLSQGDSDYVAEFLAGLSRTFRKLYTLKKPVVAAINGHAIAGGCLLALACEYRLMSEGRGTMGVPEIYVGVPFPPMAMEILRAGLAPHVVEDLMFTGRLCPAVECLALGLVQRLVAPEQLETEALKVAARFSSVLPKTYAMSKQSLRREALRRVDDQSASNTARLLEQWQSDESRATMVRFLESTVGKGK
jgi:enoyl-CoA hydratase